MGDQVKWYSASLGMHLGLLSLMLVLTANAVKYTPPISIDFTLSSSPVTEQSREKPRSPIADHKKAVTAPAPAPVLREQSGSVPQPTPVISQNAAPAQSAPPTDSAVTENVPRHVSVNPAPAVATATPRSSQDGGERMTPEKAQQRYLKEHFTYIHDLIVKRLFYPRIARRMGWSGRVVLAFVVSEDGRVHSVRVKESSGYPVLDNSAMETVKNAAPFPRPPMAAELVMPVQFRLN